VDPDILLKIGWPRHMRLALGQASRAKDDYGQPPGGLHRWLTDTAGQGLIATARPDLLTVPNKRRKIGEL
jgi:hypothetical protein